MCITEGDTELCGFGPILELPETREPETPEQVVFPCFSFHAFLRQVQFCIAIYSDIEIQMTRKQRC